MSHLRRLLAALALLFAALPGTALAGPAQTLDTQQTYVAECGFDALVAAPTSWSPICLGTGAGIDGVSWANWGADQTVGTGTVVHSWCNPRCSEPEIRRFPGRVTLSGKSLQQCGERKFQYTHYVLEYDVPAGDPLLDAGPQREERDIGQDTPTASLGDVNGDGRRDTVCWFGPESDTDTSGRLEVDLAGPGDTFRRYFRTVTGVQGFYDGVGVAAIKRFDRRKGKEIYVRIQHISTCDFYAIVGFSRGKLRVLKKAACLTRDAKPLAYG